MTVTDEQVATLRAQLAGDVEKHERLLEQLDRVAAATGYSALIAAGLFEAAYRRFAKNGTVADVVEFVADVRTRSEDVARDLDPVVAERVIRAALGDGRLDDLDDRTVISAQVILLAGLIGDEQLDEAGLDAFMAEVRATAEEWTS